MATIKLSKVRLAFPELWEAKTVQGEGKPAFSAVFLIDPQDKQIAAIQAAIDAVAKDKWGAKTAAVMKEITAKDRGCLHDGDLKSSYAGFEGNMYVSARNTLRPTVVDSDKTPLTQADGRPYSGCYVNAVLELWAQDNQYGKRINATLMGVQFYRDGEAFVGGGVAAFDDFDDVSDDDGAPV